MSSLDEQEFSCGPQASSHGAATKRRVILGLEINEERKTVMRGSRGKLVVSLLNY